MSSDETTPPTGPEAPGEWLMSFRPTRVYDSYASRAARTAVMLPILNVLGDKKGAPKAFSDLRRGWYRRVLDLKGAGWRVLKTAKDANFMMNCPPFSVETGKKAIPCGRAYVCPFCYARQWVIRPFRLAEKVLYGCVGEPKEVAKPIRPDLRVLWFRSERGIRAADRTGAHLPWNTDSLVRHVGEAYDGVRISRRTAVAFFGAEAGCVNNHLVPDPKNKRMHLVRGGVMLMPARVAESPAGAAGREAFARDGGECGLLPPSRKSLYDAFVRGMKYSRALIYGGADWAAAALNCAPASAPPTGPCADRTDREIRIQ